MILNQENLSRKGKCLGSKLINREIDMITGFFVSQILCSATRKLPESLVTSTLATTVSFSSAPQTL